MAGYAREKEQGLGHLLPTSGSWRRPLRLSEYSYRGPGLSGPPRIYSEIKTDVVLKVTVVAAFALGSSPEMQFEHGESTFRRRTHGEADVAHPSPEKASSGPKTLLGFPDEYSKFEHRRERCDSCFPRKGESSYLYLCRQPATVLSSGISCCPLAYQHCLDRKQHRCIIAFPAPI